MPDNEEMLSFFEELNNPSEVDGFFSELEEEGKKRKKAKAKEEQKRKTSAAKPPQPAAVPQAPASGALVAGTYAPRDPEALREFLASNPTYRTQNMETFGKSLEAGVGDVAVSLGGGLEWSGAGKVGKAIREWGKQVAKNNTPAAPPKEFEWRDLLTERYWTEDFPRMLPYTASLLPLSLAGGVAGGAVGGPAGAMAGAGALSGPAESFLEAGSVYADMLDKLLAQGVDERRAEVLAGKAAHETFTKNIALNTALNAVEFGTEFGPVPKVLEKAAGKSTVRKALIGAGRAALGAGQEAFQEVAQERISSGAKGEKTTPAQERAAAAGAGVMGALMGLGGSVFNSPGVEAGPEVQEVAVQENPRIAAAKPESSQKPRISPGKAETPVRVESTPVEESKVPAPTAAPETAAGFGPRDLESAETLKRKYNDAVLDYRMFGLGSEDVVRAGKRAGISRSYVMADLVDAGVEYDRALKLTEALPGEPLKPEEIEIPEGPAQPQQRTRSAEETVQPQEPLAPGPAAAGSVTAAEPSPVSEPERPPTAEPKTGAKFSPKSVGKSATVWTERGTQTQTRYAVVDADDVVASHDTALRENPDFPKELQPRNRSRVASEGQILEIASKLNPEWLGESPKASEGSPIVGPDGIVETGNGRIIALRRVYEQNTPKAKEYRDWLTSNAERFGLDPEVVKGVNRPVLVRIRETDVDRERFVNEANVPSVAAMSATEQAEADAKRLSSGLMSLFSPDDEGNILNAANKRFVVGFMREVISPSERGKYMAADGSISQEGVNRIRNAVFAKAYGNTSAIEKLAESTDNNVRNITGAMLAAAPRLAKLKEDMASGVLGDVPKELDLTGDIAKAMIKLSQLRESGVHVQEYLVQQPLFGESDLSDSAKKVLGLLYENSKSRKKLTAILNAYADVLEVSGDKLFKLQKPTVDEVIEAAVRKAGAVDSGLFAQAQSAGMDGTTAAEESPGTGRAEAAPTPIHREGLSEVEARAAERVNETTEKPSLAVGLSVKVVKEAQGAEPSGAIRFSNPAIEARWQAAKGIPKPPAWDMVREVLTSLKNKATREFEHLPHTGEFAELRNALLRLQKQRGVASDKTVRFIQSITAKLSPQEYDLFSRKVILDDLAAASEDEKAVGLPFGFTEETLEAEKKRIDALADQRPNVAEAVAERKRVWDALKDEYVEAMKATGRDVSDKLTRESYFHHQVLEYAQQKSLYGASRKLRSPLYRSFLKRREGSALDINTDYLQAEYEVMAQMLYDTEVAKTIKLVDDKYNVMDRLKEQAKNHNIEAIKRRFKEQLAKARIDAEQLVLEGLESDPGEVLDQLALKLYRASLNRKQAMGFARLKKLAESRELPYSPEFARVIEELSDVRTEEKDLSRDSDEPVNIGLGGDIMPDVFRYLSWLMNQEGEDVAEAKKAAALIFRGIQEKRKYIRETLGKEFVTWQDLVPDGYSVWQPTEGNMLFLADSIPAKLAEELRKGVLGDLGVVKKQMRKVLALGGPKKQLVVKDEVAQTLDNLRPPVDANVVSRAMRMATGGWKGWVLGNPKRALKYNLRNLSGDAEAVFVGNPSAFRKVVQASRELYDVIAGDRAMAPELREWFSRGGMQSTLDVQELGDLNQLHMFLRLAEAKKEGVAAFPVRAWQGYWKMVRLSSQFRESILRYAAYLDYLDQIKVGKGKPKNFGASVREEVMALTDWRDRAFKLSNDLLGAYDQVSVLGQALRDHALPFWSWQEVNFKRYVQFFKNAARDGGAASAVGRKLAIASPRIAYNVGKFVLKAAGVSALLALWNHTFFPDEEEELPESVRSQPHIVFGRDKDGKVIHFTRLGMLGDFLEWFGLDEAPQYVSDFLNGRRTAKEIALDMAKSPANKLVGAVTPFFKTTAELASGKTFYPDVFRPGSIRDRGLYLARALSLEEEYRAAFGLPQRSYAQSLRNVVTYETDPGESAYYDILDLKYQFVRERLGKPASSFAPSARSNALYNLKTALRYGDKKAADKYLAEYVALGGTRHGLRRSLDTLDPLYGLSRSEQSEFRKWLSADDRKRLDRAIGYYKDLIAGTSWLGSSSAWTRRSTKR